MSPIMSKKAALLVRRHGHDIIQSLHQSERKKSFVKGSVSGKEIPIIKESEMHLFGKKLKIYLADI